MTSAVPAPLSAPLDADAILCALVLVPSAYSRNQHPDLYDKPEMRRAHRRARVVRGLVRQMITHGSTPGEQRGPTGYVIHIEAPELGYRREARLSELSMTWSAISSPARAGRAPRSRSLGSSACSRGSRAEAARTTRLGRRCLVTPLAR